MFAIADTDAVIDLVHQARDQDAALYPEGGGTALEFGLPPRKPGYSVEL